ncbi:MAG: undecaprenyl-phosphate glucose phosphotransferase [Bacteroidia bacterium]|nr:undecaprenyl-phosphate glucose phosphotransferase [Bacteroidia bacterium]
MKVKKQRIIFGYILLELILLNLAMLISLWIKTNVWSEWPEERLNQFLAEDFIPLALIYNISWILIVLLNGNADHYVYNSLGKRLRDLAVNSFILLGMSSTVILLLSLHKNPLTILIGPIVIFAGLNLISFLILNRLFGKNQKQKNFGLNLLVLGAGKSGKQVLNFTQQNQHLGYKVVGFLDDHYPRNNGINLLGGIEDLNSILDTQPVDEIVITLPATEKEGIKSAIQAADYRGIRVNIVPEYPELDNERYESYQLGPMPVLQLKQTPLDHFENFMLKKIFDTLFALAFLIFFSPVFAAIAIMIKLNSKGPVFYKPVRKGEAGGNFVCYKFRTMYVDQSKFAGMKSTTKDDPRITKVGKFLRRTSLDEIPQFINVLKGDMSVVGPRPHRLNLNDEFQATVDKYMIRQYVKPGITGWAQVNGWRGPTETEEQKLGRATHDLWYVENWSFWLDIKIIWLTVFGKEVHNNAF